MRFARLFRIQRGEGRVALVVGVMFAASAALTIGEPAATTPADRRAECACPDVVRYAALQITSRAAGCYGPMRRHR